MYPNFVQRNICIYIYTYVHIYKYAYAYMLDIIKALGDAPPLIPNENIIINISETINDVYINEL